MKALIVFVVVLLITFVGVAAYGKDEGQASHKDIYQEAYVYGFPMVMNYGIMYEYFVDRNSGQFKAPFNQIYNEARVFTPKDTAIVTPNSDTPYSFVGMDLRAEPLVFSLPEVEKNRYYVLQFVDMYTHNYAYLGTRSTGNDAGCYMVAGPNWKGKTPSGIKKVIHCETQFSLAGIRTQLLGADDMPNVAKVQAGYKVQPLSQFLKQSPPEPAPAIDFPPFEKDGMKLQFPKFLNYVLQFCPPVDEEKALRARFSTVGIEAGKPFELEKLSDADKTAEALAVKDGYDSIAKRRDNIGNNINGWLIGSILGDRAFYHGDWVMRAAGAMAGIYGNSAEEAVYPLAKNDADGQPLDGSKNNYKLTFAPGEYPPVNAFWSVTMYDGKTQLLVENSIDRYLINSPMLSSMKKNDDGSVSIYIQKDPPAAEYKSNWLPAPDGPIYLVMRLYWPKDTQPSILPAGSGTWKPPAIEVAK
ncbi:DUF1254 domain-containing protein [Candidatus Obscuribacterales bacterium]|nr:DUF1254 domain-containing protein [Candidatus Obscuribacterales bacterium]MBX3152690.1 DUF1254 domain-containing protein [Candidatus Obscuribacterales bacterium]